MESIYYYRLSNTQPSSWVFVASAFSEKAITYDRAGNVTSDATNNLQSSYNLINLPAQIKSGATVKANYTYLSDGTKVAASKMLKKNE